MKKNLVRMMLLLIAVGSPTVAQNHRGTALDVGDYADPAAIVLLLR